MAKANPQAPTNGNIRVPFDQRDGATSDVFFTRDLSPEGLRRAVAKVAPRLSGKIAIKLHTGEKDGPNIIPFDWVKELVQQDLPDATIVETNTYYEGDRYTTEQHRETIAHNGWTFCPVDIMDEEGVATLPVASGKWFDEMHVGTHMLNYDSMLTLTHFKGHTMGRLRRIKQEPGHWLRRRPGIGKGEIHTVPGSDNLWSIAEEELMERITESTKATIDFFGSNIVYVNVMRQYVGVLRLRRHGCYAGCHTECGNFGIDRHLRHRLCLRRSGIRHDRSGALQQPRSCRTNRNAPWPASALVYARAGHGQLEVSPARPGQRRNRNHPS